MEFYDQDLDKWTLLDSTSVGREGAGLVSLGDSLYCIGGELLHTFYLDVAYLRILFTSKRRI